MYMHFAAFRIYKFKGRSKGAGSMFQVLLVRYTCPFVGISGSSCFCAVRQCAGDGSLRVQGPRGQ